MSRPDIPVKIGADDREFKSAMTRIRMQARTAANDTASSFMRIKSTVGGLDSAVGFLRAGPAGIAASIGLGVMVAETRQAVDAVTDLGKAAKTAGIDFEAFQELRYAAVKNRVEIDALTDGLKEMQLRADEFVKTGGGSAAESFERLGLNARDLTRMLRDPANMFDTLIGKIRQLDQAARIRVLDEIFGGTAAEQFSSLMDDTGQSIAEARQEARDMGAVMDEELLRKAEDINAEWAAMALIVETRFKGAVVDVAGGVLGMLENLRIFRDELDKALQKAGNAGIWTSVGEALGVDMDQKMVWNDRNWVPEDEAGKTGLSPTKGGRVNPGATQEEIDANYEELRAQLDAAAAVTQEIDRQNSLTADQLALEREIASLRSQYEKQGAYYSEDLLKQKAEESLAAKKRRAEESRKSTAAAKVEKDAVKELLQALQDELQMTGMAASEKKAFENVRRAGAAATREEREAIRDLTFAIEEQKDKQEQAAETADFFRDSTRDSFLSLIPVIETGNDALDGLISRLIEATAQAALFGNGPLGGLFGGGLLGGLFPAHATGTNFTQGGMALVGERGPELVNLPRGGEVIPNHRLAVLSGAGGDGSGAMVSNISLGGVNITMPEGTRAEDAEANGREIRRQLDQFSRHELPVLIEKHQRNRNRR